MPPRAIASHVCSAILKAASEPVRDTCRSRNSSTIDGGNLGAPPNPPCAVSNPASRPATACEAASSSGRLVCASSEGKSPASALRPDQAAAFSARAAAIRSDSPLILSLFSRHAPATAVTSCTNRARGKYVPQKKGSPSGVMKTVIGQPPWPVIACVAAM